MSKFRAHAEVLLWAVGALYLALAVLDMVIVPLDEATVRANCYELGIAPAVCDAEVLRRTGAMPQIPAAPGVASLPR